MAVEIMEKLSGDIAAYATIPIAFEVRSRYKIFENAGEVQLIEEPVDPYIKDYDLVEAPTEWPRKFDLSSWAVFEAFESGKRVGGAVVAFKSPSIDMLDGRDDIACLWDIRVSPKRRGSGIGTQLFAAAADWAYARGVRILKVETQDINVPACRFYARQGCELAAVNRDAYPIDLNEVQLVWHLAI